MTKTRGFTLVEIMIVVAIIGMLSTIAIPNFVRARSTAQKNACKANLRQIDGAKNVYAIDRFQADTVSPNWAAIVPNYIKRTPSCPAAGTYTIGTVNTIPTCSSTDHTL